MNPKIKYVLALFLCSQIAMAGPDYEAQFEHSVSRWLSAVEYYRAASKPMGLVYLCKSIESRDLFSDELSGFRQLKSEDKVLGYEASLVVFHFEKPSQENQLSWLRLNFYIGIAFHCNLDGFQ